MIGQHIKQLWGYFYYLLFLKGNLVSPQIFIYCHSQLNFPKGNKFPWNLKKWIIGIFRSMAGVPYVLILKFDSQNLIEVLGIFSKRLIFSQNIFPGQSFVKRSQIKNSLQTENLSRTPCLYIRQSILSNQWISVEIGTKSERLNCHMHKSSGQIPTRRLVKPPCQYVVPKVMIYRTSCEQFL